ncbi:MAG: GIY-YIG nuclease family protein [Candidatus Marinimicrobia bacterium]|nr:GIY-YIG nuclease family protein [Candidatus Neomarinimicrobiota bacterium]
MSTVYILKNKQGRYYIGSTINIDDRLKHHKGGFTPSTKRLGEMELVFSQEYKTLQEARKIERKLKSFKKRKIIEKIVKEGIIKIQA